MSKLYLNVGETEWEGKPSYQFIFHAKDKYSQKDEKGNETPGVLYLYGQLLERDAESLIYFWDCMFSHHKKRPAISEIQEALAEASDDGENFEPLFKEAFQVMDESGFFEGDVKKFWKQMDIMDGYGETDIEKKMFEQQLKETKQARKELNPSHAKK